MLTKIEIYEKPRQKSTFDLFPVCSRLDEISLVLIPVMTVPWLNSGKIHAGTEARCRACLLSGGDKSSGTLNLEKSQWSAGFAQHKGLLVAMHRARLCVCVLHCLAFLFYESVCRSLPAQVALHPHL